MRGLLLNQLYYVTNPICSIVAYQKMYMVFIGFHCYNTVTFRITDIIYLLFNIVSNRTFKYLFTVLGNENNMYFKAILASVAAIVFVIHRLQLRQGFYSYGSPIIGIIIIHYKYSVINFDFVTRILQSFDYYIFNLSFQSKFSFQTVDFH